MERRSKDWHSVLQSGVGFWKRKLRPSWSLIKKAELELAMLPMWFLLNQLWKIKEISLRRHRLGM